MKDLEARLGRARVQASEVEEKGTSELRRVAGELKTVRKEFSEKEVTNSPFQASKVCAGGWQHS